MKTLQFFLILNLIIIISLLLRKNINSNTLESFQENTEPTVELTTNPSVTFPPIPDFPVTDEETTEVTFPPIDPLILKDTVDNILESDNPGELEKINNKGEVYNLEKQSSSMDTLNLLKNKCPNLNTEQILPENESQSNRTIHVGAMMLSCLGNWVKYNLYSEYQRNFDTNKNVTYFFDTNTKNKYKLTTTLNNLGEPVKQICSLNGKPCNSNIIPKAYKWNKYIQTYELCSNDKPIRCNNKCVSDRSECVVPTQPPTTQPATTQPATTQPATTQPATTQPATTQPATTQPATTQPATTQPATTIRTPIDSSTLARQVVEKTEGEELTILDKVKNFFVNLVPN